MGVSLSRVTTSVTTTRNYYEQKEATMAEKRLTQSPQSIRGTAQDNTKFSKGEARLGMNDFRPGRLLGVRV